MQPETIVIGSDLVAASVLLLCIVGVLLIVLNSFHTISQQRRTEKRDELLSNHWWSLDTPPDFNDVFLYEALMMAKYALAERVWGYDTMRRIFEKRVIVTVRETNSWMSDGFRVTHEVLADGSGVIVGRDLAALVHAFQHMIELRVDGAVDVGHQKWLVRKVLSAELRYRQWLDCAAEQIVEHP